MAATFADLVSDPHNHVVRDFSIDSPALLILFGGIAGGVSMPVFEFFRMTEGYPTKRLFLRDPRQAWYQRGIPGVGDNEAAIAEMLLQRIKESGATRVVMAGASAGGFAAMRFGPQCGADVVIAFSPQAFIGASARAAAGDERWPEQIAALHAVIGAESPGYQVRELLEGVAEFGMETQVHFSAGDALDTRHAEALSGVSGVTLTAHPGDDHKLVKQLRNQGMLAPMVLGALHVD